MSKPSVRKNAAGRWVAKCADPCKAQAMTRSWGEAMSLAATFARHAQKEGGVPRG